MKRLVGILLLMIHINTSMFIPVVDETDNYDKYGNQVNDINTLTQYISQEILGHKNIVVQDQDDDQAHFFNIRVHQYTFQFSPVIIKEAPVYTAEIYRYDLPENDPDRSSITHDVIVPPPWFRA